MMKLGMICNRQTQENLDFVKSIGLEFIEVCNNNQNDIRRFMDEFGKCDPLVRERGLFYGSIGRWNPTAVKNGAIDPDDLALMNALLDLTIEAHCPTFVCGINYDDTISLYKNYSIAIEYLGKLIEKTQGTKTRIAVCNCDWNNYIVGDEQWKVILGELPDLMIKFDPSHSYNAGRKYMDEMYKWGSRFAHVHLKGTVHTAYGRISDPPAGMDDLNWGSIFAALYGCGYDGCLSIEPHSGPWQIDSDLGRAGVEFTADFARKFIL